MNHFQRGHNLSRGTAGWLQTILLVLWLCFNPSDCNPPVLENVALHKPAVIDSLYDADPNVGKAIHAVDGDSTSTNVWDFSCAHSNNELVYPKWWIVDLLRPYEIHKVLITNRDDFAGRLQDFTIDVFDEDPVQLIGFPTRIGTVCHKQQKSMGFPAASETATYTCGQPVTGRFVRVIKHSTFALVMCEVQVMAVVGSSFRGIRLSGYRSDQLPFSTSTNVVSYLRCATLCGKERTCNNFVWNPSTRQCDLLKISPYGVAKTVGFQSDAQSELTIKFK